MRFFNETYSHNRQIALVRNDKLYALILYSGGTYDTSNLWFDCIIVERIIAERLEKVCTPELQDRYAGILGSTFKWVKGEILSADTNWKPMYCDEGVKYICLALINNSNFRSGSKFNRIFVDTLINATSIPGREVWKGTEEERYREIEF